MAAWRATVVIDFSTASGTKTGTGTTVTGDLPVIVVAQSDDSGVPTVTDNDGGTYVRVNPNTMTKRSSADHGFFFVRTARVASGKSTIFSIAPGSTTGGGGVALLYSGMTRAGADAVRQDDAFETAQAPGATPEPVFGANCLTTNPVIAMMGNATNPAGVTPPSGFTERSDIGYATPTEGLEVATRDSGFTSDTVTWGSTSATAFYCGAIELDASTGTVSGTGSWVQAAATWAATAAEKFTATAALDQAAATWSATATEKFTATATLDQAAAAWSATLSERFTSTAAFVQAAATWDAAALERLLATASWAQSQTLEATGQSAEDVLATATWDQTEAWAASVSERIPATAAWDQAAAAWSSTGQTAEDILATAAWSQDASWAATGAESIPATAAWVQLATWAANAITANPITASATFIQAAADWAATASERLTATGAFSQAPAVFAAVASEAFPATATFAQAPAAWGASVSSAEDVTAVADFTQEAATWLAASGQVVYGTASFDQSASWGAQAAESYPATASFEQAPSWSATAGESFTSSGEWVQAAAIWQGSQGQLASATATWEQSAAWSATGSSPVVGPPTVGLPSSSAGRRRKPRARDQFGYVAEPDFAPHPIRILPIRAAGAFAQAPAIWVATMEMNDDLLAMIALDVL